MGLTRFAIERPIIILLLMIATVFIGIRAYFAMRVELNPDVSFGIATVTTVYPGAGPEVVSNLVTREIEEATAGIADLRETLSTSQEGVSVVTLNFEIGTDMTEALNEVRASVDRVVGELPEDAERPIIDKFDTGSQPIMYLALTSESLSSRELRDLGDNEIGDRIGRIPGVANVGASGGDIREIQIQVSEDSLRRYGIGILDVTRAIQAATLDVPGGRIVDGDEEYSVRLLGEFDDIQEIGESYIRVADQLNPQGEARIIRLSDVATIVDGDAERRTISRVNGEEAVVLVIQKTKEGNAVEISKALTEGENGTPPVLEEISGEYDVDFEVTLDTSPQIEESIEDLVFALVFGIILVTISVWLFLHNFRGTLIVGIAIPICLLLTLTMLWIFGFTINNLSMLAMSLAIGVLVDDAIVIIENIYRHLTLGEEPKQAAINGRAEIGLAAVAITLADVVVFLPIGFMGGIVGQFFRPLGLGYAVAVLSSLFVSFTITPMLAARWYKKGEDWENPKGRFARAFERFFQGFANRYANLLKWALKRRWRVFGGGFVVLIAVFMFIGGSFVVMPEGGDFAQMVPQAAAAGFGVTMPWIIGSVAIFLGILIFKRQARFSLLITGVIFALIFPLASVAGSAYRNLYKQEDVFKFAFFPPSDTGQVQVDIDTPPGTNLAETARVSKRIEEILINHPEVEFTVANIGTRGGGFSAAEQGTNYVSIIATLHEKFAIMEVIKFWEPHHGPVRYKSDQSIAADILQEIGRVPGAKITVSAGDQFGAGAAIQLGLQSNDPDLLLETAIKIRDGLAEGVIEGVITPELSTKPGKPELRAIPNRAKLADSGLSVGEVGQALRALYTGDDQAKYRVQGEQYDIRVMLDLDDRNNPRALDNVPISHRQGDLIRLSDVADIDIGRTVDKVDRRERKQEIVVGAGLLPGYAAGSVQANIDQWVEDEGLLPQGVEYKPLGQADFQAQESAYLFGAIVTGLLLVYMLLAVLFENLIYPFIIQLAQPQAMVGAILALVITDKTLNIVGMIGIIALIGLVGKNAILLVDYTNTLRGRGEKKFDALVESGRTRLRPIMMTTLSLIAGMLPVALAIGRGSEFRETIGITIIGGMLLSTVLTLLVIPCSYSIFDDFSEWMARVIGRKPRLDADDDDLIIEPYSEDEKGGSDV